jgi:adiponectin receptor
MILIYTCSSQWLINVSPANIWSHLIGALYICGGLYQFLSTTDSQSEYLDVAAVSLFFLCCTTCFALSAVYHTLSDHSQGVHDCYNKLDHLGILVVLWGAGASSSHFIWSRHPEIEYSYLLISTTVALACGRITQQPKFRTRKYRTMRVVIYVLSVIGMSAPFFHGWYTLGLQGLEDAMDITSFMRMVLLVGVGGGLYVSRIPERWFPITFDLLGQSHNWLHVLVLIAGLVRLQGLLELCVKRGEYTRLS